MQMSRINEALSEEMRKVRDDHAKYMKEKYAQVKLAMPKEEAEALDEYCKGHKLSKAGLLRELIKEELKSAKRSDEGIGRVGKKMNTQGD